MLYIWRRKSWISSDNPSFSTYLLMTSWNIKSKNLDFTLIIQDFQLIVQSKLKILDYRLKIQVFQSQCPIIWKTWIFESKILDYRVIIKVFQSHIENLGLSIESPSSSWKSWIINWKSWIFDRYNPRCWSKSQDFRFIGHWAYHRYRSQNWCSSKICE